MMDNEPTTDRIGLIVLGLVVCFGAFCVRFGGGNPTLCLWLPAGCLACGATYLWYEPHLVLTDLYCTKAHLDNESERVLHEITQATEDIAEIEQWLKKERNDQDRT